MGVKTWAWSRRDSSIYTVVSAVFWLRSNHSIGCEDFGLVASRFQHPPGHAAALMWVLLDRAIENSVNASPLYQLPVRRYVPTRVARSLFPMDRFEDFDVVASRFPQ